MRDKGSKLMAGALRAGADGTGPPVAIYATSASLHEVTLVADTLTEVFVEEQLERLIGDLAYDSDPLDEALQEYGIEMIAPHRRNRKRPPAQDRRILRRNRRRRKIERLFAWLRNFRRIATRHARYLENYLGFVYLGCIRILLRAF